MPKELENGMRYGYDANGDRICTGAGMGRRNTVTEPDFPVRFHLVKMRMSAGGDYDQGGAYWGCGNHQIGWMFHAWGDAEEFEQEVFIRALNRTEAKAEVLKLFPNAKFYR
jgi:hypothetical protein